MPDRTPPDRTPVWTRLHAAALVAVGAVAALCALRAFAGASGAGQGAAAVAALCVALLLALPVLTPAAVRDPERAGVWVAPALAVGSGLLAGLGGGVAAPAVAGAVLLLATGAVAGPRPSGRTPAGPALRLHRIGLSFGGALQALLLIGVAERVFMSTGPVATGLLFAAVWAVATGLPRAVPPVVARPARPGDAGRALLWAVAPTGVALPFIWRETVVSAADLGLQALAMGWGAAMGAVGMTSVLLVARGADRGSCERPRRDPAAA